VVESVKAASDVYSPIAGEVTEVNAALANTPELINQDPFGAGWIARLKPNDAASVGQLLSAADYEVALKAEED
jgi:glycine cleavage system H protein